MAAAGCHSIARLHNNENPVAQSFITSREVELRMDGQIRYTPY